MKREEELLREACAQIAQEETEALDRGLREGALPVSEPEAEALFKRHKRQVLSLIEKNTPRARRWGHGALRIAACLVMLVGASFALLSQSPPDTPPAAPVYTASVAPFRSPAQTPAPSPAPTVTVSPTASPSPVPTETILPTSSPKPSEISIISPTLIPAPTVVPTVSPTQAPTAEPQDTKEASLAPAGWAGRFFPGTLPTGYALEALENGTGYCTAVYRRNDCQITFTEYESSVPIAQAEGAALSYVQIGSVAALRMETETSVILAWEAEGRTLTLTCVGEEAESIARSVEKISND